MKQPGDKIRVSTWDGKTVVGTVVRAEEDIKNGRPGYDYQTADGEYWWCYEDQVE